MDGDEKLLAAFRIECVEHLEGIRAGLTKMQAHGAANSSEFDEVFRRAHSLKGAARVTGATEAEQLAHRLEGLFARIRDGRLPLDKEVLCVAGMALDTLEDVACAADTGHLPDVQPVTDELDRIVCGAVPAPKQSGQSSDLEIRLRAAFEDEYQDYLDGIRSWIEKAGHQDGSPGFIDVEEALRCAHSLQGAANAANLSQVAELAQQLEQLLSQVRSGKGILADSLLEETVRALQAIEGHLSVPGQLVARKASTLLPTPPRLTGEDPLDLANSLPANIERPACPSDTSAAVPAKSCLAPIETVRLSAENLDRLLQSTSQIMLENLKQDVIAQEVDVMSRHISSIETHWKSFKKAAGARQLLSPTSADGNRVNHGLDLIERELRTLSLHARSVRIAQQRNVWSFRLLSEQLQRDVRRARMVPAESIFQGFRKMMRELARDEGKQLEFVVYGLEVAADRMVLQSLKDPLMHALRNAVTHGIEQPDERKQRGKAAAGVVALRIEAVGNRLAITVEDDGRGVNMAQATEEAVRRGLVVEEGGTVPVPVLNRMLFQSGFSTAPEVTELSGRGIGLSVVKDTVVRLQGEVELESREGFGTSLSISVPLVVSTHRLLLVSCCGQIYAIPLYGVASLQRVARQDIETVEGSPVVMLEGQVTPVVPLAHLLELEDSIAAQDNETLSLVVLRSRRSRLAVAVDALLTEHDSFIKNLGSPAESLTKFSGGILLEDGAVALVLNPPELVECFRLRRHTPARLRTEPAATQPPTILVVDDSFTTRTLETSILETHGYSVRVAVDGLDALTKLRSEKIDLVITDIQMPRLDGFGLLEEMKKDARLTHIPAIIVSSVDQREDQQRGLNLGADAYIVKKKFDHQDLLQTIQQIL